MATTAIRAISPITITIVTAIGCRARTNVDLSCYITVQSSDYDSNHNNRGGSTATTYDEAGNTGNEGSVVGLVATRISTKTLDGQLARVLVFKCGLMG